MGRKSAKRNYSTIEEGLQKIDTHWLDRLILRIFKDVDSFDKNLQIEAGEEFTHFWRYKMGNMCTGLPFSRLETAFHDRYCMQSTPNSSHQLQLHNYHNSIAGEADFPDNNNQTYDKCPDLDHDATEEILRRLPVPSLMRAKSVCKSWNTATSATTFNLLNVEETHLFVMQTYQGIAFFSSTLNRWFRIPLLPRKRWSLLPNRTQFYLCAAAAGFYFFLEFDQFPPRKPPVIINPITKQRLDLPPLPDDCYWTEGTAVELIAQSGHGHGHFDIIALGFQQIEMSFSTLLYNSTTDKWTVFPAMPAFPVHIPRHPWTSAVHNGVVYFTRDYGRHLGCYDIAGGVFQFKQIGGGLPSQMDFRDHGKNMHASLPSLVACSGKLLLVGRLEKEAEEGSIVGRFPFIKHTLVGIWELDNNNGWSWSLISVTPQDLLEDTVKSSHGTDFVVAASSDRIWLTITGSVHLMSLDMRSMEWSVLPGCPAEDLVDCFPRRAVCGTLSIGKLS